MLLGLPILGACRPEDPAVAERLAAMEARVERLEARPTGPSLKEQVDGIEARLDALTTATSTPALASTDPLRQTADGRVLPVATDATALRCAYDVLRSVRQAELSYDAAFDGFSTDMKQIGWAWDRVTGCDTLLAFQVTVDAAEFQVRAVITKGDGRGRQFEVEMDGAVYERGRLSPAELGALRRRDGWIGALP